MVTASATTNSATVSWRIPSFTTQESYYVLYGKEPTDLDQRSSSIQSSPDTTLTNQVHDLTIDGLDSGSVYYLSVVAVFDVLSKRQSEQVVIWTNDEGTLYAQLLYECLMSVFFIIFRTSLLPGVSGA